MLHSSEMLGHSTSAFTTGVYTKVAEELADAAASDIAALRSWVLLSVPDKGRDQRFVALASRGAQIRSYETPPR